MPVSLVEALLSVPGDGTDRRWNATLPLPQSLGDDRLMPVMPGGFDDNAPQMAISGLGDAATADPPAAGMFRWYHAGVGRQARVGC